MNRRMSKLQLKSLSVRRTTYPKHRTRLAFSWDDDECGLTLTICCSFFTKLYIRCTLADEKSYLSTKYRTIRYNASLYWYAQLQ